MKNYSALLLVLCTLFTSISFSQDNFKIGLNLGGQYTNLRGFDFPTDGDFQVAPMYGINLEYALTEKVSIFTGLNFERLTKKTELTFFDNQANQSGAETFKENYNFFNVPLLV